MAKWKSDIPQHMMDIELIIHSLFFSPTTLNAIENDSLINKILFEIDTMMKIVVKIEECEQEIQLK